jgi:hypothetical protein
MPRVRAEVIGAEIDDERGGIIVHLYCPTGGGALAAHIERALEFEVPESPAARVYEVKDAEGES